MTELDPKAFELRLDFLSCSQGGAIEVIKLCRLLIESYKSNKSLQSRVSRVVFSSLV